MKLLHILPLLLILAACGTLEVGVERTPTPDGASAATAAALSTQVAALQADLAAQATRVARLEQPRPAPTATPDPAPAIDLGRLAYVRGGDIWVITLPDGAPRRLTADGRNREPRWSPSGQWLSFRKDGALFVMRADGSSSRPIGSAGIAAWSPAADHLAYITWDADRLLLIEPEALPNTDQSGDGRVVIEDTLPEGEYLRLTSLAWSADGARIAFTLSRWRSDPAGDQPTAAAIWAAPIESIDTPEPIFALPEPPDAGLVLADWTPDGEGLLLWRDEGFSDYLSETPLQFLPLGGELTALDAMQPYADFRSRSPSENLLALTLGAGTSTWENKRIALFSPADGGLADLTDAETVAMLPTFSPDGSRIAYTAMPVYGDLLERRIWVRDQADGLPRQLTGDPLFRDEYPRWSADGEHLLFTRMTRDGRASVWLIAAAGSTPRRLIDELTPAPDWFSNDGHIPWGDLLDWWQG